MTLCGELFGEGVGRGAWRAGMQVRFPRLCRARRVCRRVGKGGRVRSRAAIIAISTAAAAACAACGQRRDTDAQGRLLREEAAVGSARSLERSDICEAGALWRCWRRERRVRLAARATRLERRTWPRRQKLRLGVELRNLLHQSLCTSLGSGCPRGGCRCCCSWRRRQVSQCRWLIRQRRLSNSDCCCFLIGCLCAHRTRKTSA